MPDAPADRMKALEPLVGEWTMEPIMPRWGCPTGCGRSSGRSPTSPLDFRQRWTATFGPDGRTITGRWEIAHGDEDWETDFDLRYEGAG